MPNQLIAVHLMYFKLILSTNEVVVVVVVVVFVIIILASMYLKHELLGVCTFQGSCYFK